MKFFFKRSLIVSISLFLVFFQIESNAQEISVTDIDITDHPRICITARTSDAMGDYLIGLDSSNYNLWQNQRDGSHIMDNYLTSNTIDLNEVTSNVYTWREIFDYENGDVDRFMVSSRYIRN